MTSTWGPPGLGRLFAVLVATSALAACSGSVIDGQSQSSNFGCVDDSKMCIDHRQAELRALQADTSRKWVRQPPTVGNYATGVRLFAFKNEKGRMTCDELGLARREADNAPGILRSPAALGLNPAVVSRSLMFATDVSRDLGREQQRRCRI